MAKLNDWGIYEAAEVEAVEDWGIEPVAEPEPTFADSAKAEEYSNPEKVAERVALMGTKAEYGLGELAARQDPTDAGFLLGLAKEESEKKDDLISMPNIPLAIVNHVSSMVAKGYVDLADMFTEGDVREDLIAANQVVRKEADKALGSKPLQYTGNVGQKFGWEVAEGIVNMAPALALGYATRNPGMTLGYIGGQVGGLTYSDYMEKTGDHNMAMAAAKFNVLAEVIPETVPVFAILKKTKAGEGLSRMLEATLGEGAQEMVTEILQSSYDKVTLENMSLKDALKNIDWAQVGYAGLLGVFIGGGLATPGAIMDTIAKPTPLDVDFKVKTVEENATAIDEALAATPGAPIIDPGAPTDVDPEAGFQPVDITLPEPITPLPIEAPAEVSYDATIQPPPTTAPTTGKDALQDPGMGQSIDPETGEILDFEEKPGKIPTAEELHIEANKAASSPLNNLPEPTEDQISADNYSKGHAVYDGLKISIENPAGSKRRPEWPALAHHYGDIKALPSTSSDKSISQPSIAASDDAGNTLNRSTLIKKAVNQREVIGNLVSRISTLNPPGGKKLSDGTNINTDSPGYLGFSKTLRSKINGLLNIPSDRGSSGKIEAHISQAISDGAATYTHLFGDLADAEAIASKGFDSLAVERKKVVKRNMITSLQDLEIFKAVIELVPVDVMDMLIGEKASPQMLLKNTSMLTDRLSADLDAPVEVGRFFDAIAASHPIAFAASIAKKEAALGVSVSIGSDAELSRASGTSDINGHSEKNNIGADGDPIDVFINKDNTFEDTPVFIVNQTDESGVFDEHKVMLGFNTEAEARKGYLDNYSEDWVAPARIPRATMSEFKEWLKTGNTKSEYVGETEAEGKKLEAKADTAMKKSEAGKKTTKTRLTPSPETDDLITYIRKLGGINIEFETDLRGRLSHLDRENRIPGLRGIEQKGGQGLTLDRLGESLIEAGFLEPDPNIGNGVDASKLTDLLFQAEGTKIYSKQNTAEIERVAEEHYQAQKEDDLVREAQEMAEFVKDNSTYSQVASETARLITIASSIDEDATIDIASKDTSEEDVQQALQQFIDEATNAKREKELEASPGTAPATETVSADQEKPRAESEKQSVVTAPQPLELTDEVSPEQAMSDAAREKDEKRSGLDKPEPQQATTGDDLFAAGGKLETDLFIPDEAVDTAKPERRSETGSKARALFDKMTREDLVDELLKHELTGIKGRKAFVVDVQDAAVVASIDADSLKWINDNLSPDHGDALLQAVADTLEAETDGAYHISGDEFYVLGETQSEVEAAVNNAVDKLSKAVITATKPDGTVITLNGLNITHGIGESKDVADQNLKREKASREEAGERAARGEQPPGSTIQPTERVDPEGGVSAKPQGKIEKNNTTYYHGTTKKFDKFILGNLGAVFLTSTESFAEDVITNDGVMDKGGRILSVTVSGNYKQVDTGLGQDQQAKEIKIAKKEGFDGIQSEDYIAVISPENITIVKKPTTTTEEPDAKQKTPEKKAAPETSREKISSRLLEAPTIALDRSKTPPGGEYISLADIKLSADAGIEVITHTAEYWLNDIDKRILEMNQLRGCI